MSLRGRDEKKIIIIIVLVIFVAGCINQEYLPTAIGDLERTETMHDITTITPTTTFIVTPTITPTLGPISPEAEAYLNEFLEYFLQNTINRNELDPETVRTDALLHSAGAQKPEDTYTAIRYVFDVYGDSHSGFMTPEEAALIYTSSTNDYPPPTGELVDGRLGYIFLGGFSGPIEQIEIHANAIRQILMELDAQLPCGWIVDLSQETGGEMYSAIAGLGPLIGEGQIGAFLYPDGTSSDWYYLDGEAGIDDTPVVKVSHPEFELKAPEAPVAVLINRHTASAGEAIAVAFQGRPNTRFFGKPTTGLTTGNAAIPMSDGALLVITRSVFVDRTGQVYGGKIIPDESTYTSVITDVVKNWLLSQPACSNP